MKILKLVSVLFISLLATVCHATPITTGLTGVLVDGSLYNVAFVDGTCQNLFDGCDDSSDFVFNTQVKAKKASEVLQSLIEKYDTNSIEGCSGNMFSSCHVLTPFKVVGQNFRYLTAMAVGSTGFVSDLGIQTSGITYDLSTPSNNFQTFAVWSKAVNNEVDVPAPGTIVLFSLALAGVCFSRSRKNV